MSSSCESAIEAGPATTGPAFVSLDYFVKVTGDQYCLLIVSPFDDQVAIEPLAQGDYDLSVDLYEVTSHPGDPYDGEIHWVREYTDHFSVVPEPDVALLLGFGLMALAAGKRGR